MEGRKEGVGGELPASAVYGHPNPQGPYMEELSHSVGLTTPTSAASLHDPLQFSSWSQSADTASYMSGGFTGWNSFQPTLDLMSNTGGLSQPTLNLMGNAGGLSQPMLNNLIGNTGELSQPVVDIMGTAGGLSQPMVDVMGSAGGLSQPMVDVMGSAGGLSQPMVDVMGSAGGLSQPMVDVMGSAGGLSQQMASVMSNAGTLSQPLVDGTQSLTKSMYDDYKNSPSQPESNSDNGSEGGGHYPVTFPGGLEGFLTGPSLAASTGSGHNLYANALSQLVNYKTYQPFGTTDVFHGVESPMEEEAHPQSSTSSSPLLQSAASRPSYCEVARNNPTGAGSQVGTAKPKLMVSPSLKDGARFPDFPAAFGPPKLPFRRNKSSRAYISKAKNPNLPADTVPPVMVEPDSKMGLDDFEEPSVKMKDRGHRSFGGESNSNPQSRKGSASSIGSGSSGLEEIAYLWPPPGGACAAQLREGSPPADLGQGSQVTTFFTGSGSEESSCNLDDVSHQYTDSPGFVLASHQCAATARLPTVPPPTPLLTVPASNKKQTSRSQSAGTHVKTRCDDSKKKPFFDPKRIFETKAPATPSSRSGFFPSQSSVSSSTSSYPSLSHTKGHQNQPPADTSIPNNQHQGCQPDDLRTLLNNGKPKSNLYTSSSMHGKPPASHYINNDLRQPHKKQTNTEGRNSPNRSQDKSTNTPNERESSQTECTSQGNSQPSHEARQPAAASTGRRKPDPTGRKSAAEIKQQYTKRSRRHKETTGNAIGEWLLHSWEWCKWFLLELMHYTLSISILALKVSLAMLIFLLSCAMALAGKFWVTLSTKLPFLKFWSKRGVNNASPQTRFKSVGLEKNIDLPTTGEEAMKRLLSCRGKDPYSILGVRCDATDEEIKRYYRKQAVLVHPDKNQQPGAEEAFKILGHSFEIIGELEKRTRYDAQRMETQETETAMQEFADLLTKLHDKMQEAANLMRCDKCGGKHRRVPTERPWYNARFCDRCNTRHSAKEGDVWAESTMMGFLWHYFACMEGKIYDITEWASCQCGNFKHIQANAHHVIYRIATQGNARQRQQQGSSRSEADLEDFINHLFNRTTRNDQPGEATQSPAGTAGASGSAASTKKRRRKKKH